MEPKPFYFLPKWSIVSALFSARSWGAPKCRVPSLVLCAMSDDGSELSIEDLVDRLIAAGGPTPEATEEETAGREDRARRSRDGAAAAGITFRVGNLVHHDVIGDAMVREDAGGRAGGRATDGASRARAERGGGRAGG